MNNFKTVEETPLMVPKKEECIAPYVRETTELMDRCVDKIAYLEEMVLGIVHIGTLKDEKVANISIDCLMNEVNYQNKTMMIILDALEHLQRKIGG